ncbi:MAG TPA: methyltransferase domain-containing protein [Candidatus Dormibacteraeota bacterium]|nr:methyltransferase domain-containing protein [Candidatus Dormibacteraeota bacterium]
MSPDVGGACCDAPGYAELADWPSDVSRLLYERLAGLGFAGRSVLEIGCGYGRLLVGALVAGARLATGVELDSEALEEARERAEEAGVGAHGTFLEGDGAELELAPHDFVVLDRVICCYADGDRLLERSAALAGRAYAMTVPESRGLRGAWNRIAYTFGGIVDSLRGEERVYLHDVRRMERRLSEAGFRLDQAERLGKWHVGIYLRPLT